MSGAPDDDGFLTRWSRRKREAAREDDATSIPAATRPLAPIHGREGLGLGVRAGRASTPTLGGDGLDLPGEKDEQPEPEPMIEPPSLDLVDKDFDVAHWLKQNVPESWKLAALRRAWETDPAIRDFENPARDYALDWNTPGGAPGYGPLAETDDVEAMVRDIFGPDPEPPKVVAEATGDSMPHQLSLNADRLESDAAEQQKTNAAPDPSPVRLSETGRAVPKSEISRIESAVQVETVFAAVQNSEPVAPDTPRFRKRGGGAMPS